MNIRSNPWQAVGSNASRQPQAARRVSGANQCAGTPALSRGLWPTESSRGLEHSKTLSRGRKPSAHARAERLGVRAASLGATPLLQAGRRAGAAQHSITPRKRCCLRRPDRVLWKDITPHPTKAVPPMPACAVHLCHRSPRRCRALWTLLHGDGSGCCTTPGMFYGRPHPCSSSFPKMSL